MPLHLSAGDALSIAPNTKILIEHNYPSPNVWVAYYQGVDQTENKRVYIVAFEGNPPNLRQFRQGEFFDPARAAKEKGARLILIGNIPDNTKLGLPRYMTTWILGNFGKGILIDNSNEEIEKNHNFKEYKGIVVFVMIRQIKNQ